MQNIGTMTKINKPTHKHTHESEKKTQLTFINVVQLFAHRLKTVALKANGKGKKMRAREKTNRVCGKASRKKSAI